MNRQDNAVSRRRRSRFAPGSRLAAALVLGGCAAIVLAGEDAVGDDSPAWTWQQEQGQSAALVRGGTVVWQFRYAPDQQHPFFHPVALPDGRVLTWGSPPDHPWHHALWFSWKYLNGVNYWEMDRRTGKSEGRTLWAGVEVQTRPDHTARIEMDLVYRPPEGQAVLAETRTVDVSAPDEGGGYRFDWTSTFTAGETDVKLDRTPLPDEPGGKGFGGYAGLSVRFTGALTERQAATTSGPVEFNGQSRYRGKAAAMDYSGLIGGRPAGIAICDHPDNLNHPTPWYAIDSKTMSYFSPAVICYGPHTLKAGSSLTLRYRILVHPDRWDAARLQAEFQRFVRDSADESRQ